MYKHLLTYDQKESSYSYINFSFMQFPMYMRKRRMATITLAPSLGLQSSAKTRQEAQIVEEIDGLIRVYKDGHVERSEMIPRVTASLPPKLEVTCGDVVIDKVTNIWARFYLPKKCHGKTPFLVYFHGGGFCVGSASWSCYHEFLAELAARARCSIMSVDYRLAPENRLPAAYEDGFKALRWVKQQALISGDQNEWWSKQCNFSSVFLAGDSAGANIAHNVATRLGSSQVNALKPLTIKGIILIQPFFGGEGRTRSENCAAEPPRSALSLAASDSYWRLSLPAGSNRNHPWCDPLAKGSSQLEELRIFRVLVCVAEMDILRDRNLEFCGALAKAGKNVEYAVYNGVGHAFQILDKSQFSQSRTHEMISHIKAFISR